MLLQIDNENFSENSRRSPRFAFSDNLTAKFILHHEEEIKENWQKQLCITQLKIALDNKFLETCTAIENQQINALYQKLINSAAI